MAHELEMINGQGSMFYVGDAPWHSLGRRLIEAPKVEEAIVYAGLDWQVGLKPLFTAEGADVPAQATYRVTDGKILGVVGERYVPLQNIEAFNFFNPFLESGLATLETAGCLKEGKRIWVLAKINKPDSVIVPESNDIIRKYILLSNSHDGTLAVRVGYTPVRVVCQNTLAMSHGCSQSQLIRIKHTRSVSENLTAIGETMNLINQKFEATAEQFRLLAAKDINLNDLEKYITIVMNVQHDKDNRSKVVDNVINLFEHGRGNDLKGVKGTYWAAYNAISEYLSYERGKDPSVRLDSLWFGDGATKNDKALDTALQMLKAA